MKTVVLTSDKHDWLLRGFFHQWEKYCEIRDVVVAGFTPSINVPDWATFISLGNFSDYPVERWSNGVIQIMHIFKPEPVLLLLEDYWLTRQVNMIGVVIGDRWIENHPDTLRFDLTTDRLYSERVRDVTSLGTFDIIESVRGNQYQMSFQAGIWNPERAIDVLAPDESPWEAELNGSGRLGSRDDQRVYGTRQWPLKYNIMVNKGKFSPDGSQWFPPRWLAPDDFQELLDLGFCSPPGGVL